MTISRTGSSGHLGSAVAAVASTVRLGAHRAEVDEPPPLGGEGKAPNPAEYSTQVDSDLRAQLIARRQRKRLTTPE